MEIIKIVSGALATNTYILYKDDKAVIIDPASRSSRYYPYFENHQLLAILLTHGHFDHIGAVDDLFNKYHIPVYLKQADHELSSSKSIALENLKMFGVNARISINTLDLKEKLFIKPFYFEVIETPGHTEGSVCFKIENHLFSGDTLFKNSIGRTDLLGGDERKIKDSLRLIKTLAPSLIVHPGHGEETNLADEIAYNPYLRS